MVVLGSDDGLIASGESTFISGPLALAAALCFDIWKVGLVPHFVNGITVLVYAMRAYYIYSNAAAAAACSRITEAITTQSSSVRDLSDQQARGTCMGTVDTWSRYRQGDCLREKGPLLPRPHLFLPIWAQPSTLSSSPPVSISRQFRLQPCEDEIQESRCTSGGGRRQEAGGRRGRRGQQFLPARASEQTTSSNIFHSASTFPTLSKEKCPTTAQADTAIIYWEGGPTRSGRAGQGAEPLLSISISQSSANFGGHSTPQSALSALCAPPSAFGI